MRDLILLLFGFILGIFAGLIATIVIIYLQFGRSIAGHRVKHVVAATKEFLRTPANTGATRNKYYYSLGVLLDDMHDIDSNGIKSSTGKWPLIADSIEERWARFNKYIRPVINDINAYSFLGSFRWLGLPLMRELHALTNLCREFEKVVSALDAGFQNPAIVAMSEGGISLIGERNDPRAIAITDAYKELAAVWDQWIKCCEAAAESIPIRQEDISGTDQTMYQILSEHWAHAEQIRWTALYNFLVASTILLLAWAAVFATKDTIEKKYLLVGLCVIGILISLLWAAISIRSTSFVKLYADRAASIEESLYPTHKGAFRIAHNHRKNIPIFARLPTRYFVVAVPLIFAILYGFLSYFSLLTR
jgi:hypothetical protein